MSREQIRIEIDGLQSLLKKFAEINGTARAELRKGMRKAGAVVAKESRALLRRGTPSGKFYLYDKGGKRKRYQASAPGEPPARVYGDLAKSIKLKLSRSKLSARISSADNKAHIMEYGSVNQEPRPFLRPALANKKREVLQLLEDAYGLALRKTFTGKK